MHTVYILESHKDKSWYIGQTDNLKQRNSEWLKEFRKKYDEPSNLHVTLIQPRYVDENQIDDLKDRVSSVVKKLEVKEGDRGLFFDKLARPVVGSDGKYIFMLNLRENKFVTSLQKELKTSLEKYNGYVDILKKKYESNFNPHITVARNLDEHLKGEAEQYFKTSFICEGKISELVLPIVRDTSIEERMNPNNLTIFNL